MMDKVTTTARSGLRLRDSPHDGETLAVLPEHSSLDVLERETWLRVRTSDGRVGFVLGDYVEPAAAEPDPAGSVVVVDYEPRHNALRSEQTVRIDRAFVPAMAEIERLASEHGLTLYVTSSLRRPRQPIVNTVVPPARLSNHHVGHAIDLNLISNGAWYNSSKLGRFDSLPLEIQSFLQSVHGHETFGLRWGGWIVPADPVHIDDALNIRDETTYLAMLQSLWGVAPELPA